MIDAALGSLITIQVIVFCVIIYLEVLAFRKFVEKAFAPFVAKFFPDKWEPWWVELWREWVLPAAPMVFGGLTALLIVQYPYPEQFVSSDWSRLFFGIVAGMAANVVYPRVKYYWKKYLPPKVEEKLEQIDNGITPDE